MRRRLSVLVGPFREVGESAESRSVIQPLRVSTLIRQIVALLLLSSDELMSCAAGTNGCLDLRFRAFPNG